MDPNDSVLFLVGYKKRRYRRESSRIWMSSYRVVREKKKSGAIAEWKKAWRWVRTQEDSDRKEKVQSCNPDDLEISSWYTPVHLFAYVHIYKVQTRGYEFIYKIYKLFHVHACPSVPGCVRKKRKGRDGEKIEQLQNVFRMWYNTMRQCDISCRNRILLLYIRDSLGMPLTARKSPLLGGTFNNMAYVHMCSVLQSSRVTCENI